MIPYPDLVAALERWRMRNGLPVAGGGSVVAAAAPAPAPSYQSRPPAPAPRATAPMPAAPAPVAARVPARVQTDEPMDLGDADVLDDEMLSSEGGDFAMAFGVSSAGPQAAAYDDDLPDEKTAIGLPGEEPHTSPFATDPGIGPGIGPGAGPGPDTLDADDEILDEHDDPDPRHRP